MIEFLKKIFYSRNNRLTFVLFDDENPASSDSYKFKPASLWGVFYASLGITVLVVLLLFMFTPLGGLVYNQQDEELRASVIEISQKVAALKDSLNARDMQLLEIQKVFAEGKDTTFSTSSNFESQPEEQNESSTVTEQSYPDNNNTGQIISQNEIIFTELFTSTPEFPASYPVEGTFTRGYNADTGHFGIDIAAQQDIPFYAIAEGAIINQEWTVNYGYVLYIQHADGIVSVYKHASSVSKAVGDIVLKGDILGTVGDTGLLSSGPHLHLEIWKNGVPKNPNTYLVKS